MAFRTITANPVHAIGGAYVCLAQEDREAKPVAKRYVIINSSTLQVHGTYQGELAKDQLGLEILKLQAAHQAETDSGSLAAMLRNAIVPEPAPVAPPTPATDPAGLSEPSAEAEPAVAE